MHIELPSPPTPYPHPTPLDNDNLISTHQCLSRVGGCASSPPPPYTHPPPLDNDNVIGSNQCLCLPKAELNTKNSTKRQLCCCLVEFLLFNSIY